jgi:hypothetical protein
MKNLLLSLLVAYVWFVILKGIWTVTGSDHPSDLEYNLWMYALIGIPGVAFFGTLADTNAREAERRRKPESGNQASETGPGERRRGLWDRMFGSAPRNRE